MRLILISLIGLNLVTPSLAQDPWPMEQHDRWLSGTAPVGPDPSTLTKGYILKRLVLGTMVSHGPAITADGFAYFGSWVPSALLRKVHIESGGVYGSFQSTEFLQSTPAVSNGRVFASSPGNFNTNGRLYGVDIASLDYDWFLATGAQKVNDWDSASPTIGPDGSIIYPSTSGSVWRLNPATGATIWQRTGLPGSYHTAAFTRDDSKVIVTGGRVTALNFADGTVAWTFNPGGDMGTPSVAPNGTIVVGGDAGTIYGLNPNTGAVLWSRATLGQIRASAAFSPDGATAYVPGYDGRLYAIRVSDGVRLWSYVNNGSINSSPPVVGPEGRIYFQNRTGRLICLNPQGTVLWDILTSNSGTRGPMSLDDKGQLYVAMIDGGGIFVVSQQPVTLYPDQAQYFSGESFSGSLADLVTSDDMYLQSFSSPTNLETDFALIGTSPITTPSKIKIEVETSSARLGLALRISALRYTTNTYVNLTGGVGTLTDLPQTIILTTTPSQYVRQSDGQIAVRFSWSPINDEDPSQDGWLTSVDVMRWTITNI